MGRDGKLYWCSGTSIQGKYKNLVATAGHCVYDDNKNAGVIDNWVFVPGYYQGKTPWGIYVGKTAFTHYDFAVYDDCDRDYAFVTVYNGIRPGAGAGRPRSPPRTYKKYEGKKEIKKVEVSYEEYKKGTLDPKTSDFYGFERGERDRARWSGLPGRRGRPRRKSPRASTGMPAVGKGNGIKFGEPIVENVTEARVPSATSGPGKVDKNRGHGRGNCTITLLLRAGLVQARQGWLTSTALTSTSSPAASTRTWAPSATTSVARVSPGTRSRWQGLRLRLPGRRSRTATRPTPVSRRSGATAPPPARPNASAAYKAEEHVALKCA